jgi:Methyltransferase domain
MYETDKEVLGYVPEYQRIAETLGPDARVLELGVLSGLGLVMLQDLFPRGVIAGVDFNPNAIWPGGTIRIVAEQTDTTLPDQLHKHADAWDLIVDDASHKGTLTAMTFALLWPHVAPGGFYVIEDWFIGLPLWSATGCWNGAPVGSPAVAASYDPELLRTVQDLLLLLDEPYRGACAARLPGDGSSVESITYRYGLVVVRKVGS